MADLLMAKKKAKPKVIMGAMKASPEFSAWFLRGVEFLRQNAPPEYQRAVNPPSVQERALVEYLKKRGFKEEPPKR